MALYVRTKDGYLLEVIRESESNKSYITKPKGWIIHKDRVVKQADTIEKLCDEFVAIDNSLFGKKIKTYSTLKEAQTDKTFLYDVCYGAILTDRGIIYVAKVNDKGELELL